MNRLIAGCAAAVTVCGGLGFAGWDWPQELRRPTRRAAVNIRPAGAQGKQCPVASVGDWDMSCHDYHFPMRFPARPAHAAEPARSRVTPVARPGRRSSADRHSAAASEPGSGAVAEKSKRKKICSAIVGGAWRRSVNSVCSVRIVVSAAAAWHTRRNCQAYLACPSLGVSAISRKSHERRAKTAIQRSGR